ncbi:MAG: IS200/IS605 family transposase [Clostridia bacterium]|nr:IS200/IS605 family transposase [Clostridia bacterium]
MNSNDNKILTHTTWNCKYHIVFAPKYRRKIFYESHRKEIMDTIRELCRWKGVEIIEGEMAVDHVHLLLMIPPKMSVSGFMGYLKGKSSLIIYQKFGQAKFEYRCREFWCRGYYVDTTGKNTEVIKKYIANQLKQDKEAMQLSIDYPEDPFKGSK